MSLLNEQASWCGGNITIDAVDLGFDYSAGRIGQSVSNGSSCFFGAVSPGRSAAKIGPATRYTLRRSTAK